MSNLKQFVGIHLSGASNQKTTLVTIKLTDAGRVQVDQLYGKLGFCGGVFSDERLINILLSMDGLEQVFVDCPLNHPPCVACTRRQCPGVWYCDDLSVAYMLHLSNEMKRRKKLRRKRPVNPQTQRLWDLERFVEHEDVEANELTYTSNQAPLVNRALVLQRQLRLKLPLLELKETSVSQSLYEMSPSLSIDGQAWKQFRSFEGGKQVRTELLEAMLQKFSLEINDKELFFFIAANLEAFQAFVTSLIAWQHSVGKTTSPPLDYIKQESWVYLPTIS